MFCMNCGTQLPSDAKFCFKCGAAQEGTRKNSVTLIKEVSHETCEILYKMSYEGNYGDTGSFVAEAIGPEGRYIAGYSKKMSLSKWGPDYRAPNFSNGEHVHAPDSLVNQLRADGWEPTTQFGSAWWTKSFRRDLDPTWDRCVIELQIIKSGILKDEMKFTARAGGVKGIYNAGDSPIFKGVSFAVVSAKIPDEVDGLRKAVMNLNGKLQRGRNQEILKAHEDLVASLVINGWHPIQHYGAWFNQRFRRTADR